MKCNSSIQISTILINFLEFVWQQHFRLFQVKLAESNKTKQ